MPNIFDQANLNGAAQAAMRSRAASSPALGAAVGPRPTGAQRPPAGGNFSLVDPMESGRSLGALRLTGSGTERVPGAAPSGPHALDNGVTAPNGRTPRAGAGAPRDPVATEAQREAGLAQRRAQYTEQEAANEAQLRAMQPREPGAPAPRPQDLSEGQRAELRAAYEAQQQQAAAGFGGARPPSGQPVSQGAAQPQNPFVNQDLSRSVANTFDLAGAAGPMQGASGVSVSDNMLASKQLSNILSKDNPLMVQARTRAQEAAAARGLGNSSIAIGAGQTAMNDVALPLAQQDAGTFFDAAKFNASEANNFARDANAFGRQGAMARFGALTDAEAAGQQRGFDSFEKGLDRDLTRSENILDRAQQLELQGRDFDFRASDREDTQDWQGQENREDRAFRRDERLGSQEFTAGQNDADRTLTREENQANRTFQRDERISTQEFTAGQNDADRNLTREENQANRTFQRDERVAGQDWQAGQNQANRDFQTADREDTQAFNQSLQTQSQEFQASQQSLQNEFTRSMQRSGMPDQMLSNFTSSMQQAIGNIMSDPSMTPEQKTSAMENYYAYANSQMSWMATFYNTPMPNMRTGGTINPTPAPRPPALDGVGPPAPGTAPAPAPVAVGPNVGPVTTPPQNQVAIPAGPIFSGGGNYDRRWL